MDILSAATMLFLIMDPLGNLPIVLSILKHIDPKRRRKVSVSYTHLTLPTTPVV